MSYRPAVNMTSPTTPLYCDVCEPLLGLRLKRNLDSMLSVILGAVSVGPPCLSSSIHNNGKAGRCRHPQLAR
jgi:hypothetical protein